MDNFLNNMYLINLIIRWRRHLAIIIIPVIVLSVVFSGPYFIKPKFKSYTTIYPSNLMNYSSETLTEQMLQVFKSDDIRDEVIKKMNLAVHYNIDTTLNYYKTSLIRKWNSNVSIRKTEYESVEIEVLDTDPWIAARIIEEMTSLFNIKVRNLMRSKTMEIANMLKKQMEERKIERDTLEEKLNKLRNEFNILDYYSQVREATRGFVSSTGKSQNASNILKSLQQKGGEYELINAQLQSAQKNYLEVKTEYENSLKDLTKELTYTNIINKPIPADKKCYPIRWLIVSLSTLAAFIMSVVVIMIFENFRKGIIIEENKTSKL